MKKFLNLRLDEGVFRLRLTVGAQKRIKARYGESPLQAVLGAIDDPERMTVLLEEALDWEGNENAVTDGEAFYDLLVDNGYAGPADFAALAVDIAEQSGLLSEQNAKTAKDQLIRTFDAAFADLEEAGPEVLGSGRPTEAAAGS